MATQIVLIVEDSDDVAPLEIALTSLAGVSVVVLPSGRDAIEFLCTPPAKIAAVITDLHLPHVDGFELIKTIRADRRHSRLPIIVVSGDTQPGLRERLHALGADAFFPKPYSPAEIRQLLKGLLHAL